jgi:hypothetical protein
MKTPRQKNCVLGADLAAQSFQPISRSVGFDAAAVPTVEHHKVADLHRFEA